MPAKECIHLGRFCSLANLFRYIEGEKIAWLKKSLDGRERDVICVHKVSGFPSQRLHGGVRGCTCLSGIRPNDRVLAIALVPHRHDLDACFGRKQARRQLRPGLVCKSIPYAYRIFR